MLTDLNPPKLRNEHLTRPALVYVRQSTLIQVRDNTASAARQYQLAKRAQDLGWPEPLVVVIDQDQGRSGASSTASVCPGLTRSPTRAEIATTRPAKGEKTRTVRSSFHTRRPLKRSMTSRWGSTLAL